MLLKTIIICGLLSLATAKNRTCPKLLGELANSQSLLLYCITTHSVPVSACMSCVEQHKNVLVAYDLLAANCSSLYFDNDRINLVSSMETVLTDLWARAYCDDCFNNNNSFVFADKNQSFYDCMSTNKGTNNKCEMCKYEYSDLNTFYIDLDQNNNGKVCFDLQDSMNRTRTLWSKDLNCCQREYNMSYFSVAVGVMTLLPIFFYSGIYLITKHRERNHGIINDEDPPYNSSPPSTSSNTVDDIPSTASGPTENNVNISDTIAEEKPLVNKKSQRRNKLM